jgi:hypothetical protein
MLTRAGTTSRFTNWTNFAGQIAHPDVTKHLDDSAMRMRPQAFIDAFEPLTPVFFNSLFKLPLGLLNKTPASAK